MGGERQSGAPKRRPPRAPLTLAYPLFRIGAGARQLLFAPPDPWPADPVNGQRMLAVGEALGWGAAAGAGELAAHRFAWLRDLRAVGGDAARERGQALIKDWIGRHGKTPPLWTPALLADRIVHWIGQFDFFGRSAPQSWKAPFFQSLARQALALARAVPRIAGTAERIRALHALVGFGTAIPGAQARCDRAMRLLQPMLEAWPAHGMVAERNPSDLLAVLRDLVDIRALLIAAHHEPPLALDAAVALAGRALAALRHGDGSLALFHGGAEENTRLIDVALALAGAEAAVPSRSSGAYERAAGGDTLLLFDAAPAPPPGHDAAAHAGTLSFELSAGASRLVVNCGAYGGHDPAWRDAGRMTAAHSTLIVGDRNSAEVVAGGGLRHRPAEVFVDRQQEAGAVWIAGTHDGYMRRFGLLHRRRLFLSADGADLRGEDRLAPAPGKRIPGKTLGTPFAIRFHLHPGVAVEDEKCNAAGAAMAFAAAGGRWRFTAETGLVASIEESFYCGRGGPAKATTQIVLAGTIDNAAGLEARWAIKRVR